MGGNTGDEQCEELGRAIMRIPWPQNEGDRNRIHCQLIRSSHPLVLEGAISDWPAMQWSPTWFCQRCGELPVTVRVCKRSPGQIPREGECFHQDCLMSQLCEWLDQQGEPAEGVCKSLHDPNTGSTCHPLCAVDKAHFFAYLDYQYFHLVSTSPPSPPLTFSPPPLLSPECQPQGALGQCLWL
mmetsp:Transcript_20303/g.56292  ORF Transcript_20303/g.56292 Transcript_20303/m.56292 type:complete len:183 (-) Transcript_20303:139-687(-)